MKSKCVGCVKTKIIVNLKKMIWKSAVPTWKLSKITKKANSSIIQYSYPITEEKIPKLNVWSVKINFNQQPLAFTRHEINQRHNTCITMANAFVVMLLLGVSLHCINCYHINTRDGVHQQSVEILFECSATHISL